jgi:hypothetical protein
MEPSVRRLNFMSLEKKDDLVLARDDIKTLNKEWKFAKLLPLTVR